MKALSEEILKSMRVSDGGEVAITLYHVMLWLPADSMYTPGATWKDLALLNLLNINCDKNSIAERLK